MYKDFSKIYLNNNFSYVNLKLHISQLYFNTKLTNIQTI